jgi:hypothetical protein
MAGENVSLTNAITNEITIMPTLRANRNIKLQKKAAGKQKCMAQLAGEERKKKSNYIPDHGSVNRVG